MQGILGACAQLYGELIKLQIPPNVADGLELWQIASLMSKDDGSQPRLSGDDLLAARVRAARAGLPEPEVLPTPDAAVQGFMATMS